MRAPLPLASANSDPSFLPQESRADPCRVGMQGFGSARHTSRSQVGPLSWENCEALDSGLDPAPLPALGSWEPGAFVGWFESILSCSLCDCGLTNPSASLHVALRPAALPRLLAPHLSLSFYEVRCPQGRSCMKPSWAPVLQLDSQACTLLDCHSR